MTNALHRKNWLERNPKKVIFLIVVLAVAILAVVTEKILALKNHNRINPLGIQRYIKLREFNPLYRDVLVPNDDAVRLSDSLVQKPYVLRVDRQGFIMPSKIHEHPNLTLAFLGGSTTECTYVDENVRFPYLAGRLLEQQTGLKVNSYNAGRSGNNSLHSINVLLNKVVNLHPDLVVMLHNINDLVILSYEKTYWNNNRSRSPIIENPPNFKTVGRDLEQTFHLIRDLTFPNLARAIKGILQARGQAHGDEFKDLRGQKITIDQALLVREFSLNLQTFINICRARNITPVLMTMPSRLTDPPDPLIKKLTHRVEVNEGISYAAFRRAFDRLNQTIREVGAQNGVLVIDLAQEIPPVKEYICDVVHLNDQGSRLVASRIAARLTPIIPSLIKKPLSN
jgi:lysophospholipase L1-like esterase